MPQMTTPASISYFKNEDLDHLQTLMLMPSPSSTATTKPIQYQDSSAWRHLPDWQQCDPQRIDALVQQTLHLPTGGWYAVDALNALGKKPKSYTIAGHELVVWRAQGKIHAAPAACPHMGADLATGHVVDGQLRCPWHGLCLSEKGMGRWQPWPTYEDGVLFWVCLNPDAMSPQPYMAVRPQHFVHSVMRMDANCAPEDVIANRFDPWHAAHYHPHSFAAQTRVLEITDTSILVHVAYKVMPGYNPEVEAVFHAADARTIVMTITQGEGRDSIVSTHATPINEAKTTIVEATLATSDRPGFRHVLRLQPLLSPLLHWRARKLWQEDAIYAERRYALRTKRR